MKALCTLAALGLTLIASTAPTSAQPYGRPGYGYEDPDYDYREPGPRYRERDYRYEERGPRYRQWDYGYEECGPRSRDGRYAFNEREYLRCNPDVLRAVRRGEIASGVQHYLTFGINEGRALSCR